MNEAIRMLARSKAGHDKGRLYAVISEAEDYMLLADGRIRQIDRPKKKNRRHIQPVIHLTEEEARSLSSVLDDPQLAAFLKQYQKNHMVNKED